MTPQPVLHYFVDANSSAGYVDLFGQSFGGLANVQELSDFPEETAGKLLSRAAQEAEAVLARIRSTLANLEAMRDDTAAEAGRLDREYEQLVTEGI